MTDERRLPDQIAKEVALAEQIEREIEAMMNPPAPEPEQPPSDSVYTETVLEPETQEPAPQTELQSTEAPQDDPNSETWQSRYNTLQGKYSAEVPRYAAQLREANQYIQQLEQQVQQARTQPAPQEQPLEDRYKEAADLFGEDLVKFTREMAQAEADRRIAELKQSQQQVEQRLVQSENDRFFAQMDSAVPGWRDIDNDPAWLGWLQEYDPLLGAPRQAAIDQGVRDRDLNRLVHMFTLFKGTRSQAATANTLTPQPSRAQLEQVTPRPSGSASVAHNPQARVYSQSDIQRLLDPRHLNRLPLEQQRAIERDIDLAVAEGRIAA